MVLPMEFAPIGMHRRGVRVRWDAQTRSTHVSTLAQHTEKAQGTHTHTHTRARTPQGGAGNSGDLHAETVRRRALACQCRRVLSHLPLAPPQIVPAYMQVALHFAARRQGLRACGLELLNLLPLRSLLAMRVEELLLHRCDPRSHIAPPAPSHALQRNLGTNNSGLFVFELRPQGLGLFIEQCGTLLGHGNVAACALLPIFCRRYLAAQRRCARPFRLHCAPMHMVSHVRVHACVCVVHVCARMGKGVGVGTQSMRHAGVCTPCLRATARKDEDLELARQAQEALGHSLHFGADCTVSVEQSGTLCLYL